MQHKADLGLTQVTASKHLGMKQPTFSQYLNAVIPLNTDAVLAFSDLLRVNPVEIDPGLKNVDSLMAFRKSALAKTAVPLIGSISGKTVMGSTPVIAENLPADTNYGGITVDDHSLLELGIPKGSTLCLDLDQDPCIPLRHVVVRLSGQDGFKYFQYLSDNTYHYMFNDSVLNQKRTIKKTQVLAMHLVAGTTLP